MKIGQQGLELIKSFEGLELTAYLCPADVWTIGYGHTKTVKAGMRITERGAEELLKQDLAWVETAIDTYVTVALTQPQYDALCSFIYNVGGGAFRKSTLLKKLNAGDYEGAQGQFKRWNKASGKVLKGLTRRRTAEQELFGTPSALATPPASVAPLTALLRAILEVLSTLFPTNRK